MEVKEILESGIEIVPGLFVLPPNLNVLVEMERSLGSLAILENVTKVEHFRTLVCILAKDNRSYFDGEVDKPKISEKQIGKLISSWDLEKIVQKLAKVMETTSAELKNSQGSTQETPKQM